MIPLRRRLPSIPGDSRGNNPGQRGFPCPGRTEHGMKSRSLYGEREAIKHVRAVVLVLKAQIIACKLHSYSEKR